MTGRIIKVQDILKEIEAHKQKLKTMELEYQRVLGSLQALEYVVATFGVTSDEQGNQLSKED